ncbi:hypothetical protein PENSPDRAFT_198218 [Peniophora sp. CONT]|nr:hypothetical protein PENSPDRAFT_198218 [Peniophora sp. CONT]
MLDARRLLSDRDARKPHHVRNISYPVALDANKVSPEPIDTAPRPAPSPAPKDSLAPSPSATSPSSATSTTSSISPSSAMHRTRPTHGRKSSFTRVGVNVSSWLVRSSSGPSANGKGGKMMRISEPQMVDSFAPSAFPRPTRAGVQIVRTPQEALLGTGVSVDYIEPELEIAAFDQVPTLVEPVPEVAEEDGYQEFPLELDERDTSESEYENQGDGEDEESESESVVVPTEDTHRVPPAYSPPRSPRRADGSPEEGSPISVVKAPPIPTRSCPPIPIEPLRSRQSPRRTSPTLPVQSPLPPYLANPANQPPFDCIPLSDISALSAHAALDPSRVLVTMDTSTSTHRTTLATLVARPSNLSMYLLELLQPMSSASASSSRDVDREHEIVRDDTSSFESHDDGDEEDVEYDESLGFQEIFRSTLKTAGIVTDTAAFVAPGPSSPVHGPSRLHIFMDRPSEPYDHILAYLRAPSTGNAHQLPSTLTLADIPTLVAVRDEAHYLGLQGLSVLCTSELRARHFNSTTSPTAPSHSRGPSAGSLRTLRDAPAVHRSNSAGSAGSSGSARSAGKQPHFRAPADVPVAATYRTSGGSAGSSGSVQRLVVGAEHSMF